MAASFGDIIRVVAQLTAGVGVTVQNVYHLRVQNATPISDEDVVEDMGEYLENIYDGWANNIPNYTVFDLFKATNVTADVDLGAHAWPSLTNGSGAGEGTAPGVAALIRGRTSTPGHEGRKFFSPILEGQMTNGDIIGAVVTELAGIAGDVWDSFASALGNDYQPTIYDRVNESSRDVTETVATNNPAYQRRRRKGRGV